MLHFKFTAKLEFDNKKNDALNFDFNILKEKSSTIPQLKEQIDAIGKELEEKSLEVISSAEKLKDAENVIQQLNNENEKLTQDMQKTLELRKDFELLTSQLETETSLLAEANI